MLRAPFGDSWAAYDLVTSEVIVVSALAGWLLESPGVAIPSLVDEVVDVLGRPPDEVEVHLRRMVAELLECGLLGRDGPPTRSIRLAGQPLVDDGRPIGLVHQVLDERLVFRSSDPQMLAEIDDHLGASRPSAPPGLVFDVEPEGHEVVLRAAEEWRFVSRASLFLQLPGVINDFAARETSMLVLHAGGVRAPSGRVLVLAGVSEAGKSTLTGALVQRGCDYLGDELVGVRDGSLKAIGHPRSLVLDHESREVLGLTGIDDADPHVRVGVLNPRSKRIEGDAGRVAQIILPTFNPVGGEPRASVLTPTEALEQLLPNVMNLHQGLEIGWRTLCQLAANVVVTQITHSSACELADFLLADEARGGEPPQRAAPSQNLREG